MTSLSGKDDNNILIENIEDIYVNTDAIKREINLSCLLKSNRDIQKYCIDILVNIFVSYKKYGCANNTLCDMCNNTVYGKQMKTETITIDDKTYVDKPGITEDEINFICDNLDNKLAIYARFN